MSFYKYLFTPKLFKEYGDVVSAASISSMYSCEGFEKFGTSLVSLWSLVFSFAKYGSPMITLYLYKKGYFVTENLGQLMKISTGIGLIVVLSYCIRGFGRSQSESYRRFVRDLEEAKANCSLAKLRKFNDQECSEVSKLENNI